MFSGKSLRKALIGSTVLIGGSFLAPASALAAPCPSVVSGTAFAGEICDFNVTNSVTVSTGAQLGGISQQSYNPTSSFILNNGTISIDSGIGINIDDSSLSNGLTNNGIIAAVDSAGIFIQNGSIISGVINNAGSITSQLDGGLWVDNSTVNGNITNSGSIISNSVNNPAILLRDSMLNGDLINSGMVRADGIGNGILITSLGAGTTINGDIINNGNISADGSGLLLNVTNLAGGIVNNGTITSAADNGIRIVNSSQTTNGITNNGTISGSTAGIALESFNLIFGGITNQAGATISGGTYGIFINDSSPVFGSISNYGTITGGTNAIFIHVDSTSADIDLYGGSRVVGSIDAEATDINILGDFSTEGAISARAININSGNIFTMNNAITLQNTLTNAGTLALGATTRTLTGDYTQATGGIFNLGVQNTTTYGQLATSGTVNLLQSGAIDVDVASGANLAAGDTLSNIISGASLVGPGGGYSVTDNSRLLNFSAAANGGGTGVNLTVVDDASTSVFLSNAAIGNRGSAGAAQALDTIIALNPAGDWQNVIGALNSFSTDQQIAAAANQAAPVLMGATNDAMIDAVNTASRVVQARQESNSGRSSGQDFKTHRNLWFKALGSWGDQKPKDGVVGYDSQTYGLITGADKALTDQARAGVAVSYLNSDLSSNNGINRVDIDSYLGAVYGSYKWDNSTDVYGQVDAGYNRSDSARSITFGGLSRMAQGSYGGWNLHAGTGVGRSVHVSKETTITPKILLDYFVVRNESYDESGAGVMNLRVDSQTQDQLIPALEVKANHSVTPGVSFSLNGGLGYDLLNDHNTVLASFAGGGGAFVTRGLESSPWVVRSGAGLTLAHNDGLDVTARYDREDRGSEYNNQTVSLKLRMPF